MKNPSILVAVGALVLFAGCGASVSSKDDAAKAAYAAQQAGAAASTGAGSMGNVGADMSATVNGKSGTAEVKWTVDAEGGNAAVEYKITFNGFSSDGKNTFDGTMTYSSSVETSLEGVSTNAKTKGNLTMSGDYSSTLDMDLSQSVVVNGSGVSIKLEGYVKADGTQYDYTNESFSFTVSK